MNFVFGKDVLHHFFIKVCEGFCAIQLNSAEFSRCNGDLRWVFVETDAHFFELAADLHFVLLGLGGLEYHENHVRVLCYRDDLLTATFPLCSTFDDARQVEQLDFGIIVMNDSGNARQSGELICSRERCGVGDTCEQSGFSD